MNATYQNSRLRGHATKVVPQVLKYNSVKTGIDARRRPHRLTPLQNQYTTGTNPIIRFELPNFSILDFRKGFLTFTLTLNTTGGTYKRLNQGIWSIIQRFVIKTGQEIEDIRNYNLIQSIIYEYATDPLTPGIIAYDMMGIGTQGDRNNWSLGAKEYVLPLNSGFLSSGVLPLCAGGITETVLIELYLEDPINCVETDGANPVISISNIYFHCERLELEGSFLSGMLSELRTTGLTISYLSYENYVNIINSTVSTSNINHRSDSIDCIISILRNDNIISNPAVDDRMITYNKNNVTQYQLKLNGEFYPEEPIYCQGQAIAARIELLKWLGKWSLNGIFTGANNISISQFNNNKFLIINDINAFPGSGLINSQGTSHATATIQLNVTMSAVPVTNLRLDSYVFYHHVTKITPQGKIQRIY